MKKLLIGPIVLIFFGLVLVGSSIFWFLHYPAYFIFIFTAFGSFLTGLGIYWIVELVKKRSLMSGAALAKETILEQSNYLSQRIARKKLEKNRLDEKSKKLGEEIKWLFDTNNDLLKNFNKEEVKNG